MVRKTVVIAIMVMFCTAVYAGGPGTSGANFLKIGVGGRAMAMGETYCAISDDPSATYWNPANDKMIGILILGQFGRSGTIVPLRCFLAL